MDTARNKHRDGDSNMGRERDRDKAKEREWGPTLGISLGGEFLCNWGANGMEVAKGFFAGPNTTTDPL